MQAKCQGECYETICMCTDAPQIIPMIAYEDGLASMEWLCRACGFSEEMRMLNENGKLAHGELSMGNVRVMLVSPSPYYQRPRHHRSVCEVADKWYQVPYIINGCLVYVDNVEKYYQTALAHGAKILSEIEKAGQANATGLRTWRGIGGCS